MNKPSLTIIELVCILTACAIVFGIIAVVLGLWGTGKISLVERDICKVTQTVQSTVTECAPFFYFESGAK